MFGSISQDCRERFQRFRSCHLTENERQLVFQQCAFVRKQFAQRSNRLCCATVAQRKHRSIAFEQRELRVFQILEQFGDARIRLDRRRRIDRFVN